MSTNLKIFLLILLFFTIIVILFKLKRKKLSIRYGVFWLILLLLLIITVLFPKIYFVLADFFGFEIPSNMIFLIAFFVLFYLIFILINTVSKQNDSIKNLIQEISILKERVKKNERKK